MPDAKIDKKSVYTTIIGLFLMAALSLTKIIPELSLSGLTVLIGILFFFVLEHFDKKITYRIRFATLNHFSMI